MSDAPRSSSPVPAERVGAWLLEELARRGGVLREEAAAIEIVRLFGGGFCDENEAGEFHVSPRVREALERCAVFDAKLVLWNAATRTWQLGPTPPSPYR